MTTKKNKVPKSSKTKLTDLRPRKDTRGGKINPQGGPIKGNVGRTPPYQPPIAAALSKSRQVNL